MVLFYNQGKQSRNYQKETKKKINALYNYAFFQLCKKLNLEDVFLMNCYL